MSTPLIDKSFDGMMRQMRGDITLIWRRLGRSGTGNGGRPLSGTAAERAATTSQYWQFWQDTDGTKGLYVGDTAGGWRKYSGASSAAAGAWDSGSVNPVYARSVNVTIPTRLVAGESLMFSQAAVGSGFGLVGASSIPAGPSNNPLVQFRQMQFLNAATNGFIVNWHIVQVG